MNFNNYSLKEEYDYLIDDPPQNSSWFHDNFKQNKNDKRPLSINSIDESFFSLTSDRISDNQYFNLSATNNNDEVSPFNHRSLSPPNIFLKDLPAGVELFYSTNSNSKLETLDENSEKTFDPTNWGRKSTSFIPTRSRTQSVQYKILDNQDSILNARSSSQDMFLGTGDSRRHSIASSQSLFACPWPGCPRYFSRAYNLKSHYLIHTGSKPFICEFCDSSFARNHDMKRHIKIHSGIKSHSCPKCDKIFSRQDALTRHLRSSIKCQSINYQSS